MSKDLLVTVLHESWPTQTRPSLHRIVVDPPTVEEPNRLAAERPARTAGTTRAQIEVRDSLPSAVTLLIHRDAGASGKRADRDLDRAAPVTPRAHSPRILFGAQSRVPEYPIPKRAPPELEVGVSPGECRCLCPERRGRSAKEVRQRVEEARAVAWLSHNPHRVEELDAVARAGRRLGDCPATFVQPRVRVRLARLRVVRALVLVVRPIALVARPAPLDLRNLVGTHLELAQACQERMLGLGELRFRGQP